MKIADKARIFNELAQSGSCTKSGQGSVQTCKQLVFRILERFLLYGSNPSKRKEGEFLRGVEKREYNPLILKPEFWEGFEEVPRCEGD